jgi:AcrR family transcriptional regulator
MKPDAANSRPRRGRPGHDLESVLRTAVEVFTERGYDRTSMEDLASRLGIAKSAIYHHVESKEQLLALALDRALDGLVEVAEQTRRLEGPAITRLEHLVRGSVVVLHDQLPYVTLLLRVRGNTEVERAALNRRRQLDKYAAALVKEAERDGDVRPDVDPAITARLLFGMVNSVVEWYQPSANGGADEIADAICAIAFAGLQLRPAVPPQGGEHASHARRDKPAAGERRPLAR